MKRMIRQMRWGAGLVALSLLVSVAAHAEPTASDKAAAEALFDEGRALVAAGDFQKACVKLEASQKLDAGTGTLLYLADAYQKIGRTASAWATFREAAATARAGKQPERESVARARAAALAPKLAYLTITLDTGADASGLVVKRDGVEIKSELLATRVPIDPGSYVIEASAPGKKAWSTTIDIPASPGARAVTIPALGDAPVVAAAPAAPASPAITPPPAAKARVWTTPHVLGAVAGGVGLTALGVAGIFTARAVSKDAEADEHCDGARCRDREGVELSQSARGAAEVSSVMVGVGAVALLGGAILFFTAPSSAAPPATAAALRVNPVVGAGAGGLVIGGQF